MERKPLTHDEHLDIISKSMALANSIFMHHNTMCTNGKTKVRIIDLCYNEVDEKFYYAYVTERGVALVKEYNTFIQEYRPCEE